MNQSLISWLVGLLGVSLLLGTICTSVAWKAFHSFFESTAKSKKWKVKWKQAERIPRQPYIIGILERVFFTVMVAFNISGVGTAILTWMLIKMLTGWNRIAGHGETWRRMLAFTGLLSSMISLFFAVIGGLIVNGSIPLPKVSLGELDLYKLVQLISIVITVIGTFMIAFGYRIDEGISKDLRKQLKIGQRGLIAPADIGLRPWVFYCGLLLLLLAAILQVLLMAGTFHAQIQK